MVSIIKIVDGNIESQQPVSDGLIADDVRRHIDGLHRGQAVLRGMHWALRSAGVQSLAEPYDTALRVFDGERLICEFTIAMRKKDSPWFPWRGSDWDMEHPL